MCAKPNNRLATATPAIQPNRLLNDCCTKPRKKASSATQVSSKLFNANNHYQLGIVSSGCKAPNPHAIGNKLNNGMAVSRIAFLFNVTLFPKIAG